jgi:hypothetical protein
VVRSGLSAALTALGLLWLSRSLRLNPWFATAVVLAPFLRVFHGIIWDASWAIPVGTVALAAYAAFLRGGRAGPLAVAVLGTLLVPFFHPQDVLLAAPIGLHMLWRNGRRCSAAGRPSSSRRPRVRAELRLLPARPQGGPPTPRAGRQRGRRRVPRRDGRHPRRGHFVPVPERPDLERHKFVDGGFTSGTLGEQVIRAGKLGAYVIYPADLGRDGRGRVAAAEPPAAAGWDGRRRQPDHAR